MCGGNFFLNSANLIFLPYLVSLECHSFLISSTDQYPSSSACQIFWLQSTHSMYTAIVQQKSASQILNAKRKRGRLIPKVALADYIFFAWRRAYMIMMLWENILIAGSHQVCTQALFLCVCRCLLYSCLSLGCYFLIPGVFALSNTESAWNTAITLNHLLLPTVNNQAVKARVTFLFMYAVRSLTWKLTLSPTVLGFQVSNYNFWWLPGNTNDCGLIGARRNTAVSSWSKEWVCSVQKTFRYVLLMVWHGENRG